MAIKHNLDDVLRRLVKRRDRIRPRVLATIEATLDELLEELREITPVQTGRLRKSWAAVGTSVFNLAPYAGAHRPGGPFQPAIRRTLDDFIPLLAEDLAHAVVEDPDQGS